MKLSMTKNRFKISVKLFIPWFLTFFGTKFINDLAKIPNYSIYIFPIENKIPYLPIFFPVYFLAIPLTILPIFIIKNNKLFNKLVKAYLITTLITAIVLLLYPIKLVRPLITETGIYHQIIQFFYNVIPAYSTMPSLHMSLMVLASLFIKKENKKLGNILIILTILIAISILLVKAHYLLDLIVGFILAMVIYEIISK